MAGRRQYTHVCRYPLCRRTYRPFRRQQRYCSGSCRAAHWHHSIDRERRRAWCRKGQQSLQAQRWQAIAVKVKGCKTLGDAYRLGRHDGYAAGYARRLREERQPRPRNWKAA